MVKANFRAMGCGVEVLLAADQAHADPELRKVPDLFKHWESIFSRFDPQSELSTINLHPGVVQKLSAEMSELMACAVEGEHLSAGLVTPLILRVLENIGYSQSFDELEMTSLPVNSAGFSPIPNLAELKFDAGRRSVEMPDGVGLDLGGIVKGWAAERVVERLAHLGSVLVNVGGDIVCSRFPESNQKWRVDVLHPFIAHENIATILMKEGAVATSGTDHRHWLQGDIQRHHIIDPRINLPSTSSIITATVIAEKGVHAEVAAKTALILGESRGLDWLNSHEGFEGILVSYQGEIFFSSGVDRFLE